MGLRSSIVGSSYSIGANGPGPTTGGWFAGGAGGSSDPSFGPGGGPGGPYAGGAPGKSGGGGT